MKQRLATLPKNNCKLYGSMPEMLKILFLIRASRQVLSTYWKMFQSSWTQLHPTFLSFVLMHCALFEIYPDTRYYVLQHSRGQKG